ncbi:MAG: hypothetical protein LBK99_16515 [Opitutaceae bacterium]|jgi:hypothetical protein|nr:hypothetical protein [Opitutaceae bacterium]
MASKTVSRKATKSATANRTQTGATLVDAAIAQLRHVCAERGQKTDLARFLYGESPDALRVGQIKVAELLRQRYSPNAELLLSAREWAKKRHGIDILKSPKTGNT